MYFAASGIFKKIPLKYIKQFIQFFQKGKIYTDDVEVSKTENYATKIATAETFVSVFQEPVADVTAALILYSVYGQHVMKL